MSKITFAIQYIQFIKTMYTRGNISIVGNFVEWIERRVCDRHGFGSNLLAPSCCVSGKDTLRHITLLGGLGSSSNF